jgi:hypothetical protein
MNDATARRITSDLVSHIDAGQVDVPTVLDVYDWVRSGNATHDETTDMAALAERWMAYTRETNDDDWMMRAFGD